MCSINSFRIKMEYCMMFHHGYKDKLENVPIPKKTTLLSPKAGGKDIMEALNYLGREGWKIDNVVNLKKIKIMQWTLKRPLDSLKRRHIEYILIHCHGTGDKIEVFPPLPQEVNPLGEKTFGDDLVRVLNILGPNGWTIQKLIGLKKTRITQWILKRSK